MGKYILAHDLGTSGNKATLFNEDGQMISSCTVPYNTEYFNGNWAEQNPEDWWQAVCSSSRRVLADIDSTKLGAVSFSGQMMACICVNKKGEAIRNALIYCDQRSEKQAEELISKVGFRRIYDITGHRPSSSYSLTKLLWIKEFEPDIYNDTYRMLQAKDYMNFKLTGNYFTDFCDASGTNAFSLKDLTWSAEIVEASGIRHELLPETVASTTIIGEVTKEAFEATGIPAGTPVTAGAGDGGCATLGAGSYEPGMAYCYMGSSSWVSVTSAAPLGDEEMKTFTWAHPIEGLYQPCGTMQTAGSSISWYSELMNGTISEEVLEEMNSLAMEGTAGSGGVFYLPYLLGERSPWWNPNARGGFIGLNLNTNRKHMARAVFEGIAINLNESLKIMKKSSGFDSISFIGGGANGRALRQIFSDTFGVRINIPQLLSEATSMGAALLGGVGTGIYKDFSIVENMNPCVEIIEPDMKKYDFYQDHSKIFNKLYKDLKSTFSNIAEAGY